MKATRTLQSEQQLVTDSAAAGFHPQDWSPAEPQPLVPTASRLSDVRATLLWKQDVSLTDTCGDLSSVSPPSLLRIQQEVPSKAVLEQEMVWMKEHLSMLGSPVVLCHNDLLCKNIIHNSKEGRWPSFPSPRHAGCCMLNTQREIKLLKFLSMVRWKMIIGCFFYVAGFPPIWWHHSRAAAAWCHFCLISEAEHY